MAPTTDVGFLLQGFPWETSDVNDIGGVRTRFSIPDLIAILDSESAEPITAESLKYGQEKKCLA